MIKAIVHGIPRPFGKIDVRFYVRSNRVDGRNANIEWAMGLYFVN